MADAHQAIRGAPQDQQRWTARLIVDNLDLFQAQAGEFPSAFDRGLLRAPKAAQGLSGVGLTEAVRDLGGGEIIHIKWLRPRIGSPRQIRDALHINADGGRARLLSGWARIGNLASRFHAK